MSKYEEDIFLDLVSLLRKISQLEEISDEPVVSEMFLAYISSAIEDLSGLSGMTEKIFRDESAEEEEQKLD